METMHPVLLCMLLLYAHLLLEMMCCMLLCMLKAVKVALFAADVGGDASSATLYAKGTVGARVDVLCATLFVGGGESDVLYAGGGGELVCLLEVLEVPACRCGAKEILVRKLARCGPKW